MTQFYNTIRLTGMGPIEATLWVNYLEQYGGTYLSYDYNVRINRPINLSAEMGEEYKAMAVDLAALRIDVVGTATNHIMIFECRPRADARAIGQLICYRFLYMLQFNPEKPVRMTLISDKYDPLIEITTRAAGIGYMVF